MKAKMLTVAAVAAGALATGSLAAGASPTLTVGPSVVKAQGGKVALTATCVFDSECKSIVTARVPMPGGSALVPRGGLGGKIFSLEAGETRTLVFALTPDVRAWLKSHPRTTLIVQAKASDDTYENKWQTTLRLRLVA